jgi:hypothetical protein
LGQAETIQLSKLMSRIALLALYIFAAAGFFVASIFAAAAMPGVLAPLTLILGFIGLAYMVRRTEKLRNDTRP